MSNTCAICGTKENLLIFLNKGVNAKGYGSVDNISDAISILKNAHYNAFVDDNSFETEDRIESSIGLWRELPTTFREIDTTNACLDDNLKDSYNEHIKYQMDTYGLYGWYNYNIDIRFGCKWDCIINDIIYNDNIIELNFESPWCSPLLWMSYIADEFNVRVFNLELGEGEHSFYEVHADGNFELLANEDEIDMTDYEGSALCDEYWELYNAREEEVEENLINEFYNHIMAI